MAPPGVPNVSKLITELFAPVRSETCRNRQGTNSSYQLRVANLQLYMCISTNRTSGICGLLNLAGDKTLNHLVY